MNYLFNLFFQSPLWLSFFVTEIIFQIIRDNISSSGKKTFLYLNAIADFLSASGLDILSKEARFLQFDIVFFESWRRKSFIYYLTKYKKKQLLLCKALFIFCFITIHSQLNHIKKQIKAKILNQDCWDFGERG